MRDFPLSDDDRRVIAEAQRIVASRAFANLQTALQRFAQQQRQPVAAVTPGLQRFMQQYSDALAALQPGIDQIAEQMRSTFRSLAADLRCTRRATGTTRSGQPSTPVRRPGRSAHSWPRADARSHPVCRREEDVRVLPFPPGPGFGRLRADDNCSDDHQRCAQSCPSVERSVA